MKEANLAYKNADFGSKMISMHNPKSIAEWMRQYRAKHGLSLHEMGRFCGVTHSYIAHVESGRRKEPLAILKRLQKHLTNEEKEALILAQSQMFIDRLNE